MSEGPGHVQRAITEPIAAEPDGAWSTTDLAVRVYGVPTRAVTRAHRNAVLRATNGTDLWWRAADARGGARVFYDGLNPEARLRANYRAHRDDAGGDGFAAWRAGLPQHYLQAAQEQTAENRRLVEAAAAREAARDAARQTRAAAREAAE